MARTPYLRAAAESSWAPSATGMNGWLRVGPSDARTGIAASFALYAHFEHIWGRKQPAPSRCLGSSSYPHSEQIRYSMLPGELRVPKSGAAMQKTDRSDHKFSLGQSGSKPYLTSWPLRRGENRFSP